MEDQEQLSNSGVPHTHPRAKVNGLCIASFVLAVVSFLTSWLVFTALFALLGLTLGILGIHYAGKHKEGGKALGGWGIGISLASMLVSLILAIFFSALVAPFLLMGAKCINMDHLDYFAREGIRGNGEITSRTYQLDGPVHAVIISIPCRLKITEAPGPLVIQTDENLFECIEFSFNGGILQVDAKQPYSASKTPVLTFGSNTMTSIMTGGVTRVNCDYMKFDSNGNTFLSSSGASHMMIGRMEANEVFFDVSGTSGITVNGGKAESLKALLSGSARLDTRAMSAKTAEINASGAGRAVIDASDVFEGTASGASNIYVYGNPAQKKARPSGAADIFYE